MSTESAALENISFRDVISNALSYWKVRRILYNLVLLVVVVLVFVAEWPESKWVD